MIDSHCHLAGEEFAADLDAVIDRAREVGVSHALVILAAEDDAEITQSEVVLGLWPECRLAVGVHPHHAHLFADDADVAAQLVARRLDELPRACAVGEIGLDYHYDFSPREVQQRVFRAQLKLALERRLPVVIHTREAEEDTLSILAQSGATRGVFHCFTGAPAAATRALATGFHVSIPGVVTFPKAADLRESVRLIPGDRLLAETDSPYLAPIPFRGKRNEPAHVARVVDQIARERSMAAKEVGELIAANFSQLFDPQ